MTPPTTVVSLVPSLTELVWWLGAGHRLLGRTRFCTEPGNVVERVEAVGGTKDPNIDRIRDLRPDLVIANKEENRREDIEALRGAGLEVLLTDPNSVGEAVTMVRELGELLESTGRANELAAETEAEVTLRPSADTRVFVAVWRKPLMGLGSESYGNDVLSVAGGVNVLGGRSRYPEVTREQVAELEPELILLPDEPFRFTGRHVREFAEVAPARVIDGKLLWWYGPRMPTALRELRAILNATRR